ncbi:hypothetical protein [Photobacterium sp.]|uniref:hypothetical protein n=1 Tax=Photobacterium sp. TaxID=660 RepID=UPI00299E1FC9|nr:hypothetical protein [Photobacterium sp.]MDX1303037.1 hypothetical protein [Photobacterium sp.]
MRKLFVVLSLLMSTHSYAAFNCTVDVNRVLVYKDGSINILHNGRNDYTNICNLNDGWKGVDTVTCAMWTSMLQNVQNNNKKAIFYYDGTGSCSTLNTYGSSPAPVYIGSID